MHDGPLGIATPFADNLLGCFREFGIGQNHQVQVDEGTDVGWRMLHAVFHYGKFVAYIFQRRLKAGDFLIHHARRDNQMRHFERGLGNKVCLTDGNATGNG